MPAHSPTAMRIVFLQDHLRNGGTERQTIHLAHGLARLGIESHVVVFRKGGVLDDEAKGKRFTLHFLKQKLFKTDWSAPGLRLLLSQIQPYAVIAMGRMGNCQAGWLTRKEHPYHIISTFRTGRDIPYLYRRALKASSKVVANSHEALERIRSRYRVDLTERAEVIHNGCIFSPLPTLESKDRPSETIHLISSSMFRPQKRQIDLIELCDGLETDTPWQLALAGEGSEKEACQRRASSSPLSDRYTFCGLIDDPAELYQQADIAVHASNQESLPNFLIEAQMAGLPVVAYDVGGVRECFVDGESGFAIPYGDEALFRQKLTELIEQPGLRQQMSQAAREHAAKSFAPEAQIEAYHRLLKTL